ncbi:hypothetical protein Tco_1494675, partial [Tanacetum coccineum]
LESVEARLVVYQKNKAVFEEDIKILKIDVKLRDNALIDLKKKFEKAEKEREDLKLTLEKFQSSSKNLSKLLDSQISDKHKSGLGFDSQVSDENQMDDVNTSQINDKIGEGYHAVPPSYTGNFMPPKPDLIITDLDNKSEDATESKSRQRKPSFAKVDFVKSVEHVKSPRKSIEKVEKTWQAECPRKHSQSPRGNKRNWNNLMTKRLGSNFELKNKACFECGSFNHLIKGYGQYKKKMVQKHVWNNTMRVNHQNSARISHPHPKRNFVPRAVLMRFGLKSLNTTRQNTAVPVNTARPLNTAHLRLTVKSPKPVKNVNNTANSHVARPFNKFLPKQNSHFNKNFNTFKGRVTTAGQRAVVNAKMGNRVNAVKASACWVRRSNQKDKGVVDSGCSRHMTGNKSYLTEFEEFDGGFVAFGGNAKGGKITGKGKIRTGKLDFEDVYFVKELKFNLFSVSQNYDKKNIVLFTDTECVVLSSDIKLPDESQVLLRVPRKN